jgi:hypothetical protein
MKLMTRLTYIPFFVGAIAMLLAPAASGQNSAAAGDAWGFVSARYDTRSSASIYTGYGWRRVFAMGAVLNNPRSGGDAELLGGVGAVFRTGAGAEHWLALATLRTGTASFAQLYWLPTVRVGAVTTRAMVKWSVPETGSAPQKLTISPVSVTLPGRRVAGGLAVDMAAAKGARTSIGTGLELRLRLPRAAVGANALRDVTGSGGRLRLFFDSIF